MDFTPETKEEEKKDDIHIYVCMYILPVKKQGEKEEEDADELVNPQELKHFSMYPKPTQIKSNRVYTDLVVEHI